MKIQSSASGKIYRIIEPLSDNDKINLYRITDSEEGSGLVLKVGKSASFNGVMDREFLILKKMKEHAQALEKEYTRIKPDGLLNYQLGFPEVMETFISEDQGKRRIVIERLTATDDLHELVPVGQIRNREFSRVDLKTSVWVMGKLLKIIAFAHNQGIEVGNISSENILIVKESHCVTLFDWSLAKIHSGIISTDISQSEISCAAREVLSLLSGINGSYSFILEEGDSQDVDYVKFLEEIYRGKYVDANKAHAEFYKFVRAVWGKIFHPYTAFQL